MFLHRSNFLLEVLSSCVLQVIDKSNHELLYYELMCDGVYCALFKLHTNHNIEFLLQMSGHRGLAGRYAMFIIGESMDVISFFFLFDITVVR